MLRSTVCLASVLVPGLQPTQMQHGRSSPEPAGRRGRCSQGAPGSYRSGCWWTGLRGWSEQGPACCTMPPLLRRHQSLGTEAAHSRSTRTPLQGNLLSTEPAQRLGVHSVASREEANIVCTPRRGGRSCRCFTSSVLIMMFNPDAGGSSISHNSYGKAHVRHRKGT